MSDELDQVVAEVERARQVTKLAALLEGHPIPKPARLKIAEVMYDGGARINVGEPVKPEAPVSEPVVKVDSPLRAKLRAENPELVAKIEEAEAAKADGDEAKWLAVQSEIRPLALAELKAAKARQ